jgi:riboflavin kinase/FMN adenylyltransferase
MRFDWYVTIGVFDGVHLGHRAMLDPLIEGARSSGGRSAVVTFDPHPARIVAPRHEPMLLTPGSERLRLLAELGIDTVLVLRFDEEFSRLSARAFLDLVLAARFARPCLFVGHDQRLGRGREAGAGEIERLGADLGIGVVRVPERRLGDEILSSSSIRDAVRRGDLDRAARGLGRPFSVSGTVVSGDGRGLRIGFPTANLDLDVLQILPPEGVYLGVAGFGGSERPAVADIGRRPTFGGAGLRTEVHVLDFEGDIRGARLEFAPARRLRGEINFRSSKELTDAIAADVAEARAWWNRGAQRPGAPGPNSK